MQAMRKSDCQLHRLSGGAVENRDIRHSVHQSRHSLEPGAMLARDRLGGLHIAEIADLHRIRVALAKKRPCVAGGEGDRDGRYRDGPAMAREQEQHWASLYCAPTRLSTAPRTGVVPIDRR